MAIMKTDVTLRDGPNGARGNAIANEGDQVEALGTQEVDVIGGGKESWTKIQLPNADGVPQGWVPSDDVDPAGEPPNGPIDMRKFARQCWWERMIYDVNPYYLVAVAELRSQVSGGRDDDNVGPFRLTQAEWNAGRTDAQFGLGTYREKDIADWRMQCVMFAQMESRSLEALTSALTRQPSWVELYLAQMIGHKAAAAAIKSPNDTVENAFVNVQAADFPAGGLTRDQLLDRYAKFLRDLGLPIAAVKGQVALNRIAVGLQAALDKVRAIVDDVGNEFLSNEPNDASMPNVNSQIPTEPSGQAQIPQIPGGDPPPLVPGAGGPLGELIAAHESGRAGYGAYNRGHAGDRVRPIDFSQMTVQAIMALQALRPGDPNRLFAVGKYQLIPLTMKDAVRKLQLNPNDKLTPQLQENLFRNYLVAIKRPDVKAFITGQGSATLGKAQMALAFEFASVARPDTGLSNYGGIGGNRASVSAPQTALTLRQECQTYLQQLSSGKSPDQAWAALSPGISPKAG